MPERALRGRASSPPGCRQRAGAPLAEARSAHSCGVCSRHADPAHWTRSRDPWFARTLSILIVIVKSNSAVTHRLLGFSMQLVAASSSVSRASSRMLLWVKPSMATNSKARAEGWLREVAVNPGARQEAHARFCHRLSPVVSAGLLERRARAAALKGWNLALGFDPSPPIRGAPLRVRDGRDRDTSVFRYDIDNRVRKPRQHVASRTGVVFAPGHTDGRSAIRSTPRTSSVRKSAPRPSTRSSYHRTAASASALAAR